MWRPVTAIRLADQDLNDATVADPNWLPLLPTPPYPAYAGNMACLSFASARALSLAFGRDDIPLSVTWNRTMGLPSETLAFTGFSHLAEQMAISRVYGGIHFKFDTDASKAGVRESRRVRELQFHASPVTSTTVCASGESGYLPVLRQ